MSAVYIQGTTAQSSGGVSSLTTSALTTTSGNALFAGIAMFGVRSFSGSPVSDANTNTWANAWLNNASGGNSKAAQYFALNITGGSGHTVTFTPPGGTSEVSIELVEFSGIASASALDQATSISDTANPHVSGNVTTTTADQVAIGFGAMNHIGGLPVSTGLFTDVAGADSSPEGYISAFGIVNAAAAYTYQFRYNNTSAERVGIATFKGTGIAFVQSKTVQSSGATSVTIPSMSSTSGNFLSAFATSFTRTFSGSPITDSVGLTWSAAWAAANAGQYYAENITGNASHTVTVTPPGGSSACALAVMEFSGINTSSSLDKTANASSAAEPHTSGATATTSQASELILGGGSVSHSGGLPYSSVAGDWMDAVSLNGGSDCGGVLAYRLLSSTTTLQYGYSYGGAAGNADVAGIATFKAAPAGSAVTIGAPSVAGSGTESISGTGSVSIGVPSVQGSPLITGSGGVSISFPSVDGAGDAVDGSASRVEISRPSVSGSGTESITGDGAVAIGVNTISASGAAPAPAPLWTTNRLYTAPPAATGVALTPSGTSGAWSAWFELTPSTTTAWLLAGLVILPDWSGPAATVDFEVGLGVPGSEAAIDRFRAHWFTPSYTCPGELPRSVLLDAIPAFSRVSLRMRKNNTSTGTWYVSVTYFRKPITGVVLSSAKPQKTLPDLTSHTSLSTGAGIWVSNTWTTLIASTTTEWLLTGLIPAATGLPADWEVDIGVGATPAVITTVRFRHTGIAPVDGPTLIPFFQPLSAIPAGSKVSARPRYGSSIGSGSIGASLLYVELPL